MAGSPKISVPVDLSPFVAVDQKVKALKAKQKDLDREMAKTAKKGGNITPEMLKQSADVRKQLDDAQSELNQKKSTGKALRSPPGANAAKERWGNSKGKSGGPCARTILFAKRGISRTSATPSTTPAAAAEC